MRISKSAYEKLRETNNLSVVEDCVTIAVVGFLVIVGIFWIVTLEERSWLGATFGVLLISAVLLAIHYFANKRVATGWIQE